MRLSAEQRRAIKKATRDCFGADAQVRLFGSRVDDSKRGGDIDLLITTSLADTDQIVRAEIAFQVQVQGALGEQRIDVLADYPGRWVRPPIFAIAERTGVPL
ncbi:MAG: nucleotidyltransferase domain-containing protein [Gammaproteobacteria bacterium]|jgi:predicted nucleotidyltransferase|nr:nucleotidyltransferase domain-containing protein [Gammaproteobacteria bacterium]